MTNKLSISPPDQLTDLSEFREYSDEAIALLVSVGDESQQLPIPHVTVGSVAAPNQEGILPAFMYRRMPRWMRSEPVCGLEPSCEVVENHAFVHATMSVRRIAPRACKLKIRVGRSYSGRDLVEEALGYTLSATLRPIGVSGFVFAALCDEFTVHAAPFTARSFKRVASIPFVSGDLRILDHKFKVMCDGAQSRVFVSFHVLFPMAIDDEMLIA